MNNDLHSRALSVIPGGVNSPARAFKSVGGNPLYADRAEGPYLYTRDGRKLLDFCLSFGPMVLGHADPDVVKALQEAAVKGTSYAVTTEAEIEMAELITGSIDIMDKVRLVNSGTEAVMTALRLARGYTGRNKILKFSGCYHGHTDSMLVQAGSGVAGIAAASSAGVTAEAAGSTLVCAFNDAAAVETLVREHAGDLAAIVVEPLAANMGLVLPEAKYLLRLRELCDEVGALLIFDEVITGYRLTFGAYANLCCAKPDLITLGKIIGGGLPIGAVGGKAEIMNHLAPDGPVYQAGTLSGNPLCMAAGLANLRKLQSLNPYSELEARCIRLTDAMKTAAAEKGIPVAIPRFGSMFSVFFRESEPRNFSEVMASDTERFVKVFHGMLDAGIYLPPSPFETSFLSVLHTDALLDKTVEAWEQALAKS
ncbi:glutamate-1-semialdehyde 2,1-aminomutase [Kiritimatiellaeota bacterium B1221]|nr:glutamate-1-semialdehyde 2,1-aminomutase [Kiritimatiellaeota bacterium B1221]